MLGKFGDTSGTIWAEIKNLRETAGGHNDWFVGTKAEQNELRASELASSLYSDITYVLWASVENGGPEADVYANNKWDMFPKNLTAIAVALRAF